MEPDIHSRLKEEAHRRKTSVNRLCNEALQDLLSAKSETGRSDEDVERLKGEFASALVALVLFGSEVRGEKTEQSDRDLLIVLDPTCELDRDLYRRWDRIIPNRKLSPHFVHLATDLENVGSLWFEVALEGVLLWDPSHRVADVLRALRGKMAENRIRRQWSHGHPYWVVNDEEPSLD